MSGTYVPRYGAGSPNATSRMIYTGRNGPGSGTYVPRYEAGVPTANSRTKTASPGVPKPGHREGFRVPGAGNKSGSVGSSSGIESSAAASEIRSAGPIGGRGPGSLGYAPTAREYVAPDGDAPMTRSGGAEMARGGSSADHGKRPGTVEACALQYRSYDRETRAYTDYNGQRRTCP